MSLVLIGVFDKWLYLSVLFVVWLDLFFLGNGVLESADGVELGHGFLVEAVHTLECTLSDGFLVVCEEEASEFSSLEEVFAVVLRSGFGQHLCSLACHDTLGDWAKLRHQWLFQISRVIMSSTWNSRILKLKIIWPPRVPRLNGAKLRNVETLIYRGVLARAIVESHITFAQTCGVHGSTEVSEFASLRGFLDHFDSDFFSQ